MSWHAQLDLNYRLEAARTVARHQHNGPLRILQSLCSEGDAICHNVLVHPPGGLAGHKCMASIFFLRGTKLDNQHRSAALDVARQAIDGHSLSPTAGATCPNGQVVVVQMLAPLVKPAMDLVKQVWAAWRAHFWHLSAQNPRIWAM